MKRWEIFRRKPSASNNHDQPFAIIWATNLKCDSSDLKGFACIDVYPEQAGKSRLRLFAESASSKLVAKSRDSAFWEIDANSGRCWLCDRAWLVEIKCSLRKEILPHSADLVIKIRGASAADPVPEGIPVSDVFFDTKQNSPRFNGVLSVAQFIATKHTVKFSDSPDAPPMLGPGGWLDSPLRNSFASSPW